MKAIISQGESTTVQFKVRVEDAYKIGTEMTAFSNTQGGMLIIGVDDKTSKINGLSFDEIQATNVLLANAASENVKPAIVIKTETVNIDGQYIVVASIPKGRNKPYKDNKGIIWVKNGADKRKVFSNSELRVMMQSCGNFSADKNSVEGTSYSDIDGATLKRFLLSRYENELKDKGFKGRTLQTIEVDEIVSAIDVNFTIKQLLTNISLLDSNGQLTLTGLLLLSKSVQRYEPVFTVKCVSFVGNSIGTTQFRDKLSDRDMEGNLITQYNTTISFITRNLKNIQTERDFNTLGQLEIPLEVFVETVTNALVHRDYYINAPVRLFIFDNRIEIHSPGILPDAVTEETIKNGISVPRNKLLFEYAKYLLPYTGIGSGITRAMRSYDRLVFQNNFASEEFVITIMRDETVKGKIKESVKQENDPVNAGVNAGVKLSKTEKKIIALIEKNNRISQIEIAKKLKMNDATIYRNIEGLKYKGIIERFGSDKTGEYRIKNNKLK